MEENPEIWEYYFSDFISSMLHLETSDGISQRILRAFFMELKQEKSILERLVQLHVYMDVYHLELAKMATVLRPLDRIQNVVKASPNALSPIIASPTKELVNVVQQTRHPLGTPEHLSAFVVSHLFNALVGAAYSQAKSPSPQELASNPEKLLEWYKAYRYVHIICTCSWFVFWQICQRRLLVFCNWFFMLQSIYMFNVQIHKVIFIFAGI